MKYPLASPVFQGALPTTNPSKRERALREILLIRWHNVPSLEGKKEDRSVSF